MDVEVQIKKSSAAGSSPAWMDDAQYYEAPVLLANHRVVVVSAWQAFDTQEKKSRREIPLIIPRDECVGNKPSGRSLRRRAEAVLRETDGANVSVALEIHADGRWWTAARTTPQPA